MSIPALGQPQRRAIDEGEQRQVELRAVPGGAPARQASPRRAKKSEEGLDWKKPKSLGQLASRQSAQRHVIDQHDKLDVRPAPLRFVDAHRHIVGHDRDFRFEIEAKTFVAAEAGSDRAGREIRPSRPDTSADRSRTWRASPTPRAFLTSATWFT